MTVQITPKSTQHTGMATSTEGSVAAWQVTFELDGDESIHAAISIGLAGPPTHQEAQQKALKILHVFLNDACEAAKNTNFQIRTFAHGAASYQTRARVMADSWGIITTPPMARIR